MTGRPRLTSIDLWERHERHCMQMLRDAIALLAEGPATEGENDLNRRLYRAILAVHRAEARRGREQLSVVVPEGHNPPVESDDSRAVREHKIPDFYWAYVDHLAPEAEAVALQFVVECKRLTVTTRNWDYVAQYVHAGVLRFISDQHGYGKATRSGAMIGYLQSVDVDAVLQQINEIASANDVPTLSVRSRPSDDLVELDHQLQRAFAVTPFLLTHFWTRVSG